MSENLVLDALIPTAFSVYSNPGAYALLIGAGTSFSSQIPTAWGIRKDLTTKVAELRKQTDELDKFEDSVTWYEDATGKSAEYETLLEDLGCSPVERKRLLQGYFTLTQEDKETGQKQPTLAHTAIADLVESGHIKVIITLNFDHLLETAIRAKGIPATVISKEEDIEGMEPLHTLQCCIIHLHGDYLEPDSMLNTKQELGQYTTNRARLLTRILNDYGLVIAGWSSNYDPALRGAISKSYSTRRTMTWIEPRELSENARNLVTAKKGIVVQADADTAFGALRDHVLSMNAHHARHPLTAAVAVGTAKRELAGKGVAISVHDTFKNEIDTLHKHPLLTPDGRESITYSDDVATLRAVSELEAAAEVAVALTATLTHWGAEQIEHWWINEIDRMATTLTDDGIIWGLKLRYYLAAPLYYAAGVAAVSARRYSLLAKLLSKKRQPDESNDPLTLAAALDATKWNGSIGERGRFHRYLRPILRQALAISAEQLDEDWEMFELLRLAELTEHKPGFRTAQSAYNQQRDVVTGAHFKRIVNERAGQSTVEAEQRIQHEETILEQHLEGLQGYVPVCMPHLWVSQHLETFRFHVPAAIRLAAELRLEGERHPLAQNWSAEERNSRAAALDAISKAMGTRCEQFIYANRGNRQAPSGGAWWIDTWSSQRGS